MQEKQPPGLHIRPLPPCQQPYEPQQRPSALHQRPFGSHQRPMMLHRGASGLHRRRTMDYPGPSIEGGRTLMECHEPFAEHEQPIQEFDQPAKEPDTRLSPGHPTRQEEIACGGRRAALAPRHRPPPRGRKARPHPIWVKEPACRGTINRSGRTVATFQLWWGYPLTDFILFSA